MSGFNGQVKLSIINYPNNLGPGPAQQALLSVGSDSRHSIHSYNRTKFIKRDFKKPSICVNMPMASYTTKMW